MDRMGGLSMRRVMILSLLVLAALGPAAARLCAEEIWEGTAAAARPGDLDSIGFFAASNSFPRNSRLEVENLVNGRRTRVTVVRRIEEPAGVFLLLSAEATAALGITRSDIVRVRARLLADRLPTRTDPAADPAYSPDPDVNPLAGLPESARAPAPAPAVPPAVAEEPPAAAEPVPPPEEPIAAEEPLAAAAVTAVPEEPTAAAVEPPPPPGEPEAAEAAAALPSEPALPPEAVTSSPPAEGAAEPVSPSLLLPGEETPSGVDEAVRRKAARQPQKELFLPPRDDERFALIVPPAADPAPSPPDRPAAPPPAEEVAAQPPAVEEEAPLAEAPAEAAVVAEEPPAAAVEPPPAEARPPAVAAEPPAAAPATEPPAAELAQARSLPPARPAPEPQLPIVAKLQAKGYYLQVGAYTSAAMAASAVRELGATYEVAVLEERSRQRTLYRVLVGPLNRDESGMVLTTLKSRGYRDAFLRKPE